MTMNRFAGFADNGGVPFEKYTPAVSRTAKPKNPTKPKSRLARHEPIDDEIGKPAEKGNNMTDYYDASRGPYHAILDKMALARQAQTGESYARAFTKIYEAPENVLLRDGAQYDHLAKAQDAIHGSRLSLLKVAPPDAVQDDVDPSRRGDNPGPAHAELHRRVGDRMKSDPSLSYERAFTAEYLHPNNRSLKQRVDAESVLHAQARAPAPPFPRYTAPGHSGEASNVGRSGAKPRGYIGG
jgi:hypothetical protein